MCGTIYIIVESAYSLSVLLNGMLLTRCCPLVQQRSVFHLRNLLNDRSAEHDLILESNAKIDSN